MKRKFRDYQEKLLEDLQDPELAHHYLNEALADGDPHLFLIALGNVYAAQEEHMTKLAKRTNVSRENIYRILSKKGNPKLSSIVSLLSAVGFSLAVQPHKKR